MTRKLRVAAIQMPCGEDAADNRARAATLVREAAAGGARVVLLPELPDGPYFCKDQDAAHFARAQTLEQSPLVEAMQALARELDVVLPVSFFERAGQVYYNSVAVVDADGAVLGTYRKSHIPDGPGYQEKFYFTPGDTGFRVWDTRHARIGVGICWDQWFPEAARAMCLQGAEVLFYPTAIGSEPAEPALDTRSHWESVMRGHAGANMTPVVAANRIGRETGRDCTVDFYGGSLIAGWDGALLAQANGDDTAAISATVDLDELQRRRADWGFFRDRRPELYQRLLCY